MELPDLSQKCWQLQAGANDTEWLQLEHPLIDQKQKKREKKQFKWATSLDSMFKMNFQEACSLEDLTRITTLGKDLAVEGQEKSAAGSVGVFFVQTTDGVFVLKAASHSLASEIFATLFSLSVGVYSPKLILFRSGSDFGQHVLDAVSVKDPNHNMFGLYEQRYVLAMQYVPGCHVQNLPSLKGASFLPMITTLGNIVAIDVFLNNGDRVPFIWDNQGNSNNLHMVTRYEGDDVVVDLANIDPSVVSIDMEKFPEESADYFERVDKMLTQVVRYYNNPESEAPKVVVHLLKVVSMWSQTELVQPEYEKAFVQGFITILKKYRMESVHQTIVEPVAQFYEYLQYVKKSTTTGDSEVVIAAEAIGMNAVLPPFLQKMTAMFTKHAETIKK